VALLALPDHESYTAATQVQIQQLLLQAGADWLLTTEKDAVKLQQLPVAWLSRVITARLELAFDSEAPLKQAIERFFKIA
jgi:tetraacyldisaccharide-1-P 4'-kinase